MPVAPDTPDAARRVHIKNCGLKTPEAIICAAASGASFIGFVHHLTSPRHLDAAAIDMLFTHVPPQVARVIVLVDPSNATLSALPAPDYWQVHGVTDPARIAEIHRITGIPVITAIRIKDASDLAAVSALEKVSAHLLFDAFHPGEMGGSGITFDWALLAGVSPDKPWFLAGGLTADNVRDAVLQTRAPMVDVSSGIEDAPGVKSLEKIAAFGAAVLKA